MAILRLLCNLIFKTFAICNKLKTIIKTLCLYTWKKILITGTIDFTSTNALKTWFYHEWKKKRKDIQCPCLVLLNWKICFTFKQITYIMKLPVTVRRKLSTGSEKLLPCSVYASQSSDITTYTTRRQCRWNRCPPLAALKTGNNCCQRPLMG